MGDLDSVPGSGRFHAGEHGNPLQYPCLENPKDRGAWRAAVHGVAKSWTWLSEFHFLHLTHIKSYSTVLWRCTRPRRPFRTNTQKDVLFIIGDWNAKVGSQETPGVTGKFGFGVQNEAGQRLIEFCQENALVIANILFQQPKRRLYMWTSPDGQ